MKFENRKKNVRLCELAHPDRFDRRKKWTKKADRNTERSFFLGFSVSDLEEKADLRIECAINYDFVNTIRF